MRALITGASSGIGKDIAKILSQKGYELILVARDEEKLENTKQELGGKNNIELITMDLSKEENCKTLADNVKDIDLLVNNAGFGDCGSFEKTDLDKDIKMIETNVIAYHILTKLYLKEMIEKNSGKILNVASIAGFMPGPLMATYYATKNYVVALTRAVRKELKKKKSNVKISLLCPGPVDTNFNKVANVKFKIPGLSSEKVAQYAIDKMLKNKFMILPGTLIKIGKAFSEITPDIIKEEVAYHAQKRKRPKV